MSNIWSKLTNLGGLITGTLGVGNGGTGATTLASNGVLYGNAASAVNVLPVNATATNNFLTQSNSAAPAWATIASSDLPSTTRRWVGTAVTSSPTVTSLTYAAFSTTCAVSFTPTITGTYMTFVNFIGYGVTNTTRYFLSLVATTGSPTSLFNQTVAWDVGTVLTSDILPFYLFRLDTLTASTAYVFTLQGKASGGPNAITLRGDVADNGVSVCSVFLGN